MNVTAATHWSSSFPVQHASAGEYTAFVKATTQTPDGRAYLIQARARFVERYPDLTLWFQAPLAERVGRQYREQRAPPRHAICLHARPYLMFLALRSYAQFDWEWGFAITRLSPWDVLDRVGNDLGVRTLVEEAVRLGYERTNAYEVLRAIVGRIFLHTLLPHVDQLRDTHLTAFREAAVQFKQHPDIALFYGSVAGYERRLEQFSRHLHLLQVVLYHRNQATVEPGKHYPRRVLPPVLKPRLAVVIDRYLAELRLTYQPSTLQGTKRALQHLITWLVQTHPAIESFADVTRDHLLAFAEALQSMIGSRTGRPFATNTRLMWLSYISRFFRDVARWEWDDVPKRPLLGYGDLPRRPQRMPRYIPDDDLARLMTAIRALPCPYQRAALLIARWSGARRDEIHRLALDCLDQYPDGTARLRIPAGKTYQERVIPLNEEAATAIRALQHDRGADRGFKDRQTGIETRYLFVRYGKHVSKEHLFDLALRDACVAAGLVTHDGKQLVSAHRFRHTVGKQLAERGAKLRTIMSVLGHASATMSMVYVHISDLEVVKDYDAVLGSGATIAGPFAQTLRAGTLSESDIDWLKTNFFKTELELGHCLRLPQEGPCECDLYLNCAKFVTTPEYAPRLRQRRTLEETLVADATARGWQREVERHQCTIGRIDQLLAELGEALEGPEGENQCKGA